MFSLSQTTRELVCQLEKDLCSEIAHCAAVQHGALQNAKSWVMGGARNPKPRNRSLVQKYSQDSDLCFRAAIARWKSEYL